VLNKFFPIVDMCLSCENYSPTKLCDGAQMAILGDFFASCVFSERVQQVSDLHLKFALTQQDHHYQTALTTFNSYFQ